MSAAILINNMAAKWWMGTSLLPFHDYSSFCIVGPTGAGKTEFVYRLLQNLPGMFQNIIPKRVLYCYGIWQPKFEQMEREFDFIIFHEGLPTGEDIKTIGDSNMNNLVVLDDLLEDVLNSKEMETLMIRGCHHRGMSVIFITQNLFSQSKYARTMSLNTQYFVLFHNFRDSSQINTLGRQMFPGKGQILQEAYNDSTKSEKYGYLVVDLSPHSDDTYRLRTKIFPGEDCIVYQPRG